MVFRPFDHFVVDTLLDLSVSLQPGRMLLSRLRHAFAASLLERTAVPKRPRYKRRPTMTIEAVLTTSPRDDSRYDTVSKLNQVTINLNHIYSISN